MIYLEPLIFSPSSLLLIYRSLGNLDFIDRKGGVSKKRNGDFGIDPCSSVRFFVRAKCFPRMHRGAASSSEQIEAGKGRSTPVNVESH